MNGLKKLSENDEIKSFFRNYEIIALSETWSKFRGEFDSFLSSYVHFDSVRKMKSNSIRNSGGVSVFIKSTLYKHNIVRHLYHAYDNCVILYFELSSLFNCEDMIMYFTYISPEGSCYYDDKDEKNGIFVMQSHLESIKLDYPDISLFVAGDLNSRCKDFLDYIPDDNLFHLFGNIDYDGSHFNTPRSSKDNMRGNNFGKCLVNLCCLFDIHMLNGRLHGDHDGNFTCVSNDGASLVDYMLASSNLFQFFIDFHVLNYDDSDHFPLSCTIKLSRKAQTYDHEPETELLSQVKRFKWNLTYQPRFTENFHILLQTVYASIHDTINSNIEAGVDAITSLYHTAGHCMTSNSCRKLSLQPPWWNTICDQLKYAKLRALRKFRATNSLIDLRHFKDQRNIFKNYCRTVISDYQLKNRNLLLNSSHDPASFWKLIKNSRCTQSLDNSISPNEWYNYFAGLLHDETAVEVDLSTENIFTDPSANTLNKPFTLDEVINSITSMPLGKAAGIDGIPSEFFKATKNEIAPILLNLFNNVFTSGIIPSSWKSSVIVPIYKSGPSTNPGNYRGISITNTMYKIFSGIINKRLYNWTEDNNKIDECQSGFRRGYSAIDNIFCLQAMIQKYLSKKGGRFYCIYVDFRKAFDKINHNILFKSLQKKGIHGRFIHILKSIYSDLNSCVKTNKGITNSFPCNIGTRQGDKSSSTIFILFIDELSTLLRQNCGSGIFVTDAISDINCLMFADDVAGCAETAIKLQHQINSIDQFCHNTGMEINLDKTQITVFRNGGPLRNYESWSYRGRSIKVTSEYKYMGILMTSGLSWSLAHSKLASQAQRALFSLKSYQRSFGYFSINDYFKLFDTMVKPIICYASQIWGYDYANSVEIVHNNFCKNILYVRKTTNTCMVLGDCGRLPLCTTYYINCIRYWCNLLTMPSQRYPKQCYIMLKALDDAGRECWASKIRKLLYQYGFSFIWISQDVGDVSTFVKMFKHRVENFCTLKWHTSVDNSNRCDHYKHFKSLLTVEKYLTINLQLKYRIAMSKFRMSNHKLSIEIGRHNDTLRENRICIFLSRL